MRREFLQLTDDLVLDFICRLLDSGKNFKRLLLVLSDEQLNLLCHRVLPLAAVAFLARHVDRSDIIDHLPGELVENSVHFGGLLADLRQLLLANAAKLLEHRGSVSAVFRRNIHF